MERKFTAVYEKHGDWYIAYVEEVPGANAQGKTLDEARENLREAVELVIEANRELSRKNTSASAITEELRIKIR